jgi:hypothetical protein
LDWIIIGKADSEQGKCPTLNEDEKRKGDAAHQRNMKFYHNSGDSLKYART